MTTDNFEDWIDNSTDDRRNQTHKMKEKSRFLTMLLGNDKIRKRPFLFQNVPVSSIRALLQFLIKISRTITSTLIESSSPPFRLPAVFFCHHASIEETNIQRGSTTTTTPWSSFHPRSDFSNEICGSPANLSWNACGASHPSFYSNRQRRWRGFHQAQEIKKPFPLHIPIPFQACLDSWIYGGSLKLDSIKQIQNRNDFDWKQTPQ